MELLNVIERYFVTGTDTEVGKTIACVALLQATRRQGLISVGYKPVASGSKMSSSGLRNRDVLALQRNSSLVLPYTSVNVYTFSEPTSPHIISKEEGRAINFSLLTQGLRQLEIQAECVLVEGVGGWLTPLTPTQTFADWVKQEQLPVILVVGVKLGCINHAMLTAQVVSQAGLRLAGWIANNIAMPNNWHAAYLSTLKGFLNAPFLGEIPRLNVGMEEVETWQYLNLSALRSACPAH